MNRTRLVLFVTLVSLVLTTAQGSLHAQNNPYKIDDECYELYNLCYAQDSNDGRTKYAQQMRELAIRKGDTKAETISYVLDYITATKYYDADSEYVQEASSKLKEISLKYGYDQYYFYSYTQGVTSCLRNNRYISAINLADQMLEEAREMNSDFGYWSCYRSFANIYQKRLDKENAKKYLLLAIDYAVKVPEQSVANLYVELSSLYPYSNDTSLVYLGKALESAASPYDYGRVYNYYSVAYGCRQDSTNFYKYYNLFKHHSRQYPLQGYISNDEVRLRTLDDFLKGRYSAVYARTDSLINSYQFLSDLYTIMAEKNGNYKAASEASQRLNKYLQAQISSSAASDLAEIAEQLQNDMLHKEISHKSIQLSRMTRILLFVGLAMTLLLVAFMIRYSVHKTKINKRLMEVSKELVNARDEAMKANNMKTQFLQNMSHEIRTPLNAIVGFSQLLGLPDGLISDEEKNQYMNYIRSNSDMLTMLVDDILNIADMEHGNFRVELGSTSVNLICSKAMNTVQYRVPPGVEYTFSTDVDDSFECTTDDKRVQQILINFLTNACKHTKKGSIHVACSINEHPGMVTFSVADTGPGVPDDMAEKIFDRFIKLDSFMQGTGLGLHICRQVASRLDGDVFLDTSYKQGARFVFVIPRN